MNYDIDNLSNRYDSVGWNTLAYDAAGNLTTDKDGYQYQYDYESRITKIIKSGPTTVAEFAYDALGRRIKKRDSIANTNNIYYYNDNWQILCDYNDTGAGGTPERWFAYGNYIDEVVLMSKSFTSWLSARYYIQDHLYSPAALMGATGAAPIERYEYDAYGSCQIMDASYNPRSSSLYGNPYAFEGKRLDLLDGGDLGLMHWPYRDYSTYLGRWLQAEKLGMIPNDDQNVINRFNVLKQYEDGMNLYEGVSSNPIMNLDPYGFFGIGIPAGGIINWGCCTCLVYSEAGRRGEECMQPVIHVLLNRQRTAWADFRGEDSFCGQAWNRGRFAGGAGSTRYNNCWECKPGLHRWEYEEICKARWLCAGGGGSIDPTGGAQYWFTAGHTPKWMKDQQAAGNCQRVSVPTCTILEFWKCTDRPIAR